MHDLKERPVRVGESSRARYDPPPDWWDRLRWWAHAPAGQSAGLLGAVVALQPRTDEPQLAFLAQALLEAERFIMVERFPTGGSYEVLTRLCGVRPGLTGSRLALRRQLLVDGSLIACHESTFVLDATAERAARDESESVPFPAAVSTFKLTLAETDVAELSALTGPPWPVLSDARFATSRGFGNSLVPSTLLTAAVLRHTRQHQVRAIDARYRRPVTVGQAVEAAGYPTEMRRQWWHINAVGSHKPYASFCIHAGASRAS